MHKKNNKEEWQNFIKRWQESGRSQRQFCKENQISLSAFRYYEKKIRSKEQFVEIGTTDLFKSPLEIHIGNKNLTIKLSNSFSKAALRDLLDILGV
jgi:hypothetical protein